MELESQADWLKRGSPHYWRFQEYCRLLDGRVENRHRVLDVGCGEGHLLSLLPAGQSYGIDTEEFYLRQAQKRNPKAHLRLAQANKLPFADNFFDGVFCTEVIEHLEQPEVCLSEIRRVLRPGGFGLISTYNHFNIFNLLTLRAFSSRPRITPGHKREYNWLSFRRLLSRYFWLEEISQAGSSRFLDQFFRLTGLPLADFMIVLVKKETLVD